MDATRQARRRFMRNAGVLLTAFGGLPLRGRAATMSQPFGNGTRDLVAYPQKRPLLEITARPPHLETPFSVFNGGAITPNDAFFVRYHLPNIPVIDAAKWRLSVDGDGANGQLELTFDELRNMPATEVVAVNQCSGNRRGLFQPHVAGVQWSYGAMGCARW